MYAAILEIKKIEVPLSCLLKHQLILQFSLNYISVCNIFIQYTLHNHIHITSEKIKLDVSTKRGTILEHKRRKPLAWKSEELIEVMHFYSRVDILFIINLTDQVII